MSWPTVTLPAICRPNQWPTIPKAKLLSSGYPVFGANGRIGHYSEYNHEEPTILITCRGATCGSINVCEPKSYVTGNAMALDALDESQADLQFLFHALKSADFSGVITGVAQPQITRQSLARLEIPLPPLVEQKRISGILDATDALRAKRRESLAQLDTLLQSIFLDMFGDPVESPKCPVGNLGDHLTFVTSGSRGWAKYYSDSGARFVRSLDVRMNSISDEEVILVNPPDNAEARRTRVEKDDVLLTITGSRIGRVARVPENLDGAFISQHVAILRLGNQLIPEFVARFLSLESGGQIQIGKMQYGQTKPGLNFRQIRSFQIPIPAIEEQHRFAAIVESVEQQKARQRAHLDDLDALFASLQSRAFRGNLRA